MWMCDRCQEINDDNVTTCPKCGQSNQPGPSAAFSQGPGASTVGSFDDSQSARPIEAPIAATGTPPSMWYLMRIALSSSPIVWLVLAVILVAELIPGFLFGWFLFIVAIPSAILLARVVGRAWMFVTLSARGARTVGVAVSRRIVTPHVQSFAYVTVQYTVNGRSLLVADNYGGPQNSYFQVGDQVPVVYDPRTPQLADLDVPNNRRWSTLTIGALAGLFVYSIAWMLGLSTLS